PAPPPALAPAPTIKVGFLISDYTATGPTENLDDHHAATQAIPLTPQGYNGLLIALRTFDDPSFDRYAILEPNTQSKGRIPALLAQYFPKPNHILEGAEADQLKTLDVIVCPSVINMRDDVLAALIDAVSSGVGLLNQMTTGCNRPGLTE